MLKQLTFYGKKTVPTKLRKDLWHPYATITFPRPEQGLEAFKLLKEYRMVRDYAWGFAPMEADIAKAEQQKEEYQSKKRRNGEEPLGESERMDEDEPEPGPKQYKTHYDKVLNHYLRLPQKPDRARLLMDQRATSVADLSAIIQRVVSSTGQGKELRAQRDRDELWSKITALAAIPAEEIEKLERERDQLEAGHTADSRQLTQVTRAERTKQRKRDQRIQNITIYLNRLRKAREAVSFASGSDEVSEKMRAKWSKTLKYIAQQKRPDTPVLSVYDHEASLARKEANKPQRPSNWPVSTEWDADPLAEVPAKPKALTKRDKIALRYMQPEIDERASIGIKSTLR